MIIYHLNQLSKDKYLVLYEMYDRINSEIEEGLSMLQSEHLGPAGKDPAPVPADIKGYGILAKGIIASRGIGSGSARIVKTEGDIADFPEGAVLIAKSASTRYASLVRKASAIVTNVGAVTVHMATVAREFSIPMLVEQALQHRLSETGRR